MYRFWAVILVGMLVVVGGFRNESHGAEKIKRVTLLPIESQQTGKYSQLGDALRLMIAGRLSAKENIIVVENSIDRDEAASLPAGERENSEELFSRLRVDYIGAGSITEVDGAMDLQMTFYKREGEKPVVVSSRWQSDQEIMEAVDSLLNEIAAKVFGERSQRTELGTSDAREKGMEAFQTEHPDRKYKKEILSGEGMFAEDSAVTFSRDDMLRRRVNLADNVVTVEVDDLDGDGQVEIVTAAENGVRIYRYNRGLLEQLAVFDTDVSIHAMSIADINGDGRREICLSALDKNRFSSLVVAWTPSPSGFRVLADNIGYAIRGLEIPDQGPRLIGQSRSEEVETFFENGIFYLEMDRESGEMRRGKDLFLPSAFTLFDFTYGDIDGDGEFEKTRISDSMAFEVYDSENRLVWVSDAEYGGRDLYLGSRWLPDERTSTMLTTGVDKDGEYYHTLQYIPVQPVAVDIDGDGRQEILTARNTLTTFKALRNLRKFSDGRVVCLAWNGLEMKELWRTEMLSGYVSSVAFKGDIRALNTKKKDVSSESEDRVLNIFVAQAPGQNLADVLNFSEDRSSLIVYQFKILMESSVPPNEE